MEKNKIIAILSCLIILTLIIISFVLLTKSNGPMIYYHLNGGTNNKNNITSLINLKEDFTLLPASKSNYFFNGWFDKNGNRIKVIKKDSTKNIHLYAKWQKSNLASINDKFYISYNLNGGTNSKDNITSLKDLKEDFILLPASKIGYTFSGWFDSQNNKIETITTNLSGPITLYAKWDKIEYIADSVLPLIQIYTQNNNILKNSGNYINCSFCTSHCSKAEFNIKIDLAPSFNDKSDTQQSVGIFLKNNSTDYYPKKTYIIEFEEKESLFGLPQNKNWVLLTDYLDLYNIKNYTALTLGHYFTNLIFTPTPHHVILYLNDEYKGLYLLTEQIDENITNVKENFNVSTDTNFPFLLEMNHQFALNKDVNTEYITVANDDCFHPFKIIYPETNDKQIIDNNDIILNYIKEYMSTVYETLQTGKSVNVSFKNEPVNFNDLVDVNSFIDYYLLNEIVYNDSQYSSIYMSKTKDGKLTFGPIGDFDVAFGKYEDTPFESSQIEYCNSINILNKSMFKYFLQNENNYKKLVNRWNTVKDSILTVSNHLKEYKESVIEDIKYNAKKLYNEEAALIADYKYDYIRLFLIDRYTYLNNLFNLPFEQFIKEMQ